jgi:hypothetical protein
MVQEQTLLNDTSGHYQRIIAHAVHDEQPHGPKAVTNAYVREERELIWLFFGELLFLGLGFNQKLFGMAQAIVQVTPSYGVKVALAHIGLRRVYAVSLSVLLDIRCIGSPAYSQIVSRG